MVFGRKAPPRVTVTCEGCGKEVSTNAPTTAREVAGWIVPRKGGGANHIRHQEPTGRYAHAVCLEEAVNPGAGRQEQLFK